MNPTLLASYHALSPALKTLLGIKAAIGVHYVGSKTFQDFVLSHKLTDDAKKTWTPQPLAVAVAHLQQKKLLDPNGTIHPGILHLATVDLAATPHGLTIINSVLNHLFPVPQQKAPLFPFYLNINHVRQLRLSMYTNDEANFFKLYELYDKAQPDENSHVLEDILLSSPLEDDWLLSRSPFIRYTIFLILWDAFSALGYMPNGFVTLLSYYRQTPDIPERSLFNNWMAELYLLQGDTTSLQRCQPHVEPYDQKAIQAGIHFLAGEDEAAITTYREAIKLLRQHLRKRKVVFENFHGVFYLLVLLTSGDALLLNEMSNALQAVSLENNPDRPAFVAMHALLLLQQGCEAEARQLIQNWRAVTRRTPLCHLYLELAEFYINREESSKNISQLQTKVRLFTPVLPMMAHIFTAIIHRHRGETPPASPWRDFTTLIAQQENWQRTFQALQAWMQTNKVRETTSSSTHSKRLAWFINTRQGFIEDVVEQSFRVRQGWSDGRPVAFKRLHEQDPRLDYLTEQDRRALRTLRKDGMGWHDSYIFDTKETLQLLVGHPALFDSNNRRSPIELFSYPLELVITSTRQGFRLALSHQADAPTTFLQEESPGRFRVIHFSEKHLLLHRILPNKGLEIPEQAKQELVEMIHQQGLPLSMRVEVPGLDETAQEGDTTPVLQLRPLEQGLKCTLQVRPFGPQGPGYFPGQGNRSVLANLPAGQQRANRNLNAEKKAVEQVLTAVPLLAEIFTEGFTAPLEGLELCLEMLLQVRENPHPLVVEWPEGKPLRVYPPLDPNQISLSVKQGRDWFQVEGTAAVDPKEVVTMSRLLANLPNASGRFIPLDDGRFVALTNQLKQQLEQLQAISEASKEGNRVPQLAGFVLDGLLANCGQVQADAGWKTLQQRIRQANEHQPQLPSTLQAELRDYQLEGFQWLSRLARWGAGACLADDMGLGKTIQAIAILLEQGTLGPSLVVAPTSVCHNWKRELARFAPALQVYHLAESSDRAALLASLAPMTVVIASYGLLHNEEEALTAMDWQVMILDEAQAIKNADTRRAQASRKLKAAFRIALSGTPIENYLDELWSLFQFINPNLLGSRESFQRRFATPIEKHKDHKAMHALRTLVRPFILRRTKSMVLSELPPRTDLTLEVELPANERAFQEALRQKILTSLENLPTDNPQERRFRILAEITRLRRACCHPALIDPATPLPGAKLTLFMELVEELIRNRHKALVFSQFVTLLELVEKALRHTGIRYQYLDGSTPAKEREKRVAAFQAGEGELFLISLKAGGLGLNLTAADYVIHLDPWWNPAVEDQASDRAHRMGQQRPVTVYRMIVQGSIEEKMVKLHQEKRDLADALLEGSDTATRLSEDDLMAMLRGV